MYWLLDRHQAFCIPPFFFLLKVNRIERDVYTTGFQQFDQKQARDYIIEKIESFKYTYNLIIIGTSKTNPFLEEVHAMTNATRVTEEFLGEGKGVLEILGNPWDENKAMLPEGNDDTGKNLWT